MPIADKGYALILARRFLKDMRKLSRQDQIRVRRALDSIQADPYKGRKVSAAETGQYRWRVGDLRIRYDIAEKEIQVLRVIKREDVYRKF
jgi:mRNA-degrading endonuclease RelE of RelBE toxin-antitoxin system